MTEHPPGQSDNPSLRDQNPSSTITSISPTAEMSRVTIPALGRSGAMTPFKRLRLWALSGCALAAVPYILVLFIRTPNLPWLEKVSGLGQLLPTALALLGGGLAELLTMPTGNKGSRDEMLWAGFIFGILSIGLWAIIQVDSANAKDGVLPYDQLQLYSWSSLILFIICAVIAGIAVLIATPQPRPQQQAAQKGVAQ